LKISKEVASELWGSRVLFKWNSSEPTEENYGWLKLNKEIALKSRINIEANSGLTWTRFSGHTS